MTHSLICCFVHAKILDEAVLMQGRLLGAVQNTPGAAAVFGNGEESVVLHI